MQSRLRSLAGHVNASLTASFYEPYFVFNVKKGKQKTEAFHEILMHLLAIEKNKKTRRSSFIFTKSLFNICFVFLKRKQVKRETKPRQNRHKNPWKSSDHFLISFSHSSFVYSKKNYISNWNTHDFCLLFFVYVWMNKSKKYPTCCHMAIWLAITRASFSSWKTQHKMRWTSCAMTHWCPRVSCSDTFRCC